MCQYLAGLIREKLGGWSQDCAVEIIMKAVGVTLYTMRES